MLKILLTIALATANAPAQPSAALADERDGKTYRVVKIGAQVWMAENLNYEAEGSKCYGEDGFGCSISFDFVIKCDDTLSTNEVQANCEKYGRLYDWETALKVCPKGWHLPTKAEWEIMTKYIGGEKTEGKKLKAKSGWNDNKGKSGNGTDEYGFAALPGGDRSPNGFFNSVCCYYGHWWSASEVNAHYAYYRSMSYEGEHAYWLYNGKALSFRSHV